MYTLSMSLEFVGGKRLQEKGAEKSREEMRER
jgi:hypothetical protein